MQINKHITHLIGFKLIFFKYIPLKMEKKTKFSINYSVKYLL